jgi:hypothetical protein
MTESITLRRVLLIVGVGCLTLAAYSFIQGEIRDALLGLFLAAVLLLQWHYRKRQSSHVKTH